MGTLEDLDLRMLVAPAHRGRVTGFSVACGDHGAMPVLAPSVDLAEQAARAHIDDQHAGERVQLVVRRGRGRSK